MAKTRRRVLSILMALVLTLGLLPTSALAWGETTITVKDSEGYVIEGATVQVSWRNSWGRNETETAKTNQFGRAYFYIGQNTYSYTVTKDGYVSATDSVRNGRNTTVVLQRAGASSLPESVTFNVYRLYKNEIPSNINQSFDASLFGPDGDDTPYFTVTVDMEKLMQIDGMGEPVWKNGHWYVSLDTIKYNSNDKADWFWKQALSCMSAQDQAKFKNYFGGLFRGYVLKQESGAPHIDGVLVETPPTYTVELYLNGKVVGTNTQGYGRKHTVNQVYTMWENALATQYSSGTMDWDAMEYTTDSGTVYELKKGAWPMTDREVNYQTLGSSDFNIARFYLTSKKAETFIVKYEWANGSAEPVDLPDDSVAMREAELASYELETLPTSSDEEITGWYTDAAHTTLYAAGTALKSLAKNGVITLYAYCAPKADLTITKTFAGGDMSGVPADFDATFVVTDADGTEKDSFTYSEVAAGGATIEDLPYGTYYVEEKDLSFTNTDGLYNETPVVTFQVNGQTASAVSDNPQKVQVTLSGDTTVAVNNAYQLADKPYITVDKTATPSATVGNEITYTITVKNIGGAAATNVVVTDTLPTDGLNLENVTVSDTAAKVENGVLTWTISTLAAKNGTATLTVSGAVVTEEALNIQSGKIVNTASAHYDDQPAGLPDPSDSAETKITRSNLRITKAAATTSDPTGDTALENETITYTITVENSGDAAAIVTVVDTLPTDYLQNITVTGNPAGTISGDETEMTWSNVTIPAQSGDQPGKVELTFTATVKALSDPTKGVSIVNTVAVQGKPDLTASCTTYVAPTEGTLTIYKSLQGSELTDTELLRLNSGITFTVYDAEDKLVETFTLKEVLDREASVALDPGTYTVYENDADVTGYDLVTTVSGNEVGSEGVEVTVSASGTPVTVTFRNVYTSKMYQIIFHDSGVATLSLSDRNVTAFQWWNAGEEAQWASGGYTAADGTLAFLFGNGNKDSVKNTAIVVTEDPGYAFSGKWNTADGEHSFESFADIVNALDTHADGRTLTYQDVNSTEEVTRTVYTLDVYLDWTYDLTYTFNDFGSEHVSMAYAVGKEATTLTPVTKFGSAFAPVLVCDQKNLDDPSEFEPVIFFVKADDGYQLGEQYWEASSATVLSSVENSVVGELTALPPIERFPGDALLAAAHAAGYTHYFSYEENGVVGNVFKADVLNRYFKVVATENPTYTITGTKTVALGGNRAPGSTTFTFNLEGQYLPQPKANALSLEMGGDVWEIKDTATVTINGSGSATFQFDTIEFTEAGLYFFRVTEVDDSNNSVYWNYDDTEFGVEIVVIREDDGSLKIDSVTTYQAEPADELWDVTEVNAIVFTNVYTRSGGNNPGPGPGDGDGDGDTDIPDENTPTTDLPDENTPTTDLPDENTPTTETPEETTDLPDEETPLADVPETGDSTGVWVLAAGVSGLALVWLALTGKKRRDENA